MDATKKQSTLESNSHKKATHIGHEASELLNEGKKLKNELYNQGRKKINKAEKNVREYSDELLKTVERNPLTSVLVAAGIGFLLTSLLKK